ncbi:MAG TPA: efflux RND transporter permease subunit [Chthonomonadaceae bacterium]|nr:efflux RND transporter permease subunit [Chthonomonadaceae bacterium]
MSSPSPPSPPPGRRARFEQQAVNPLHMIHKWSIEHPYVIIAFYFAVVALAVIGMTYAIPRRFAPYVPSPMVGVVTMMPGLSAQEMELYVSKPIEEQLINVKDLHYVRSTSQDGFSLVILEFNYGTDIKKAVVDVQALLNVVQANLPSTGANLKPSYVIPVDPLNLPILALSLTGDPDKGWTPAKLREFADNTVINRIKTLSAVNSVVVFGGYRRQLQVIVDRNKLAAYGLSILDVRNAIDRYNVSRPAGTLTSDTREGIIRIDTRAQSAEDVLNYPIASIGGAASGSPSAASGSGIGAGGMGGGGMSGAPTTLLSPILGGGAGDGGLNFLNHPRVVYVRDVARVVDGYWERRSAYHFLDHAPGTAGQVVPSIEVSVIQDPAASSYYVVPAVNGVLRQLEREYPGIHFRAAYDNAQFVEILFHNVWHELGIAILLTAITVLFFLGEWRGTLIALITVPTSLAMAVLMMLPFHMTFNSGTLIGLLLVIGRLVDDTIIDIHSVERHLRMGKDPKTATIDGIAEVRLAVLASTLMLVLALVPLLFCGGITQLMFVELVWPIIFGLLASMLVSFTLTALLCANWLRHEEAREADRRHPLLRWIYVLVDPFQRLLARLESGYARTIRGMLKNRFWNFARIVATVIIGFTFYNFIGSEMMPLADVGQANGFLEMQPGTSFAQTERAVKQLEQIMLRHPELERASIEIGTESMLETWNPYFTGYQMPQVNGASMMLTFSDKDARRRDIWQIMDAIQREAMATIPGIRRLQIKEMGSDVMATAAAPIHLVLSGPDLHVLNQLGQRTLDIANHTDGMVQAATTWTMGVPDYEIRVDPARAQELGLSPEEISQQAYYALRGGLTNEFYRLPNLRQNTILVRYEPEQRRSLQDLEQLYITGANGRQVPLKSVATVEPRLAPTVIEHDGLRRVIGVTGYYRKWGPPSMDLGMEVMMKAMDSLNFPPGYNIEMRGDMTQMMDSFRRLLYGLVLALIFMYLVLVAQFRGFLQPFQMIASLPLELAGVFTALWLAHQAFSTVSIMAVIVLTGMDITTAILMIDMIMRYRDRGVPRDQAVEEAAPQRLRPILMTAMITIIVMVPVAFFPKTGLDAYQPLGTTILGGLTVGTLLSLLDIPIMHTYVDDLIRWLNKTFLGREWHWPVIRQGEGEPEPAHVATVESSNGAGASISEREARHETT